MEGGRSGAAAQAATDRFTLGRSYRCANDTPAAALFGVAAVGHRPWAGAGGHLFAAGEHLGGSLAPRAGQEFSDISESTRAGASAAPGCARTADVPPRARITQRCRRAGSNPGRSEEHTSELQ